jgi:4-alpha-glucanotransferase
MNLITPSEVHARVMNLYENYPKEYFLSCLNLIGSHDKPRILSILGEAPVESDMSEWRKQSWRLDDAQRDLAKRRLKMLSVWQMTFPGVPSVYYGDEAGAEGFGDPYNRAPFPWGREDKDIFERYRLIGNLRAEYSLFRNGEFISYGGYEHIYAFARRNERERAIVLLNGSRDASEEVTIALSRDETVIVELISSDVLKPEARVSSEDEATDTGRRGESEFYDEREFVDVI